MFRDADNYTDGNGQEVQFSQFRKFNVSATSGVSLAENKLLEGSIIYDKATDVGYPALPMDVSLAEALITSLKFEYVPKSSQITNWETKIYYNTITHKMDDTKRPSVPIHMDYAGLERHFRVLFQAKRSFQQPSFCSRLELVLQSFRCRNDDVSSRFQRKIDVNVHLA